MKTIAPEWGTAEVANIMSATNQASNQSFAAFTIKAGTDTIYSLKPDEDYEVNTNSIDGWKMIFLSENEEVLGDADYFTVIEQLKPYTLEQNNNSVLVRKLTSEEFKKLLEDTHAEKTVNLVS